MNFLKSLFLASTCLLLASAVASASTVPFTGKCKGGGSWTTTLTINDTTGRVTMIQGVSCGGKTWQIASPVLAARSAPVRSNLLNSMVYSTPDGRSTIFITCDAKGKLTSLWGSDSQGKFWEVEL